MAGHVVGQAGLQGKALVLMDHCVLSLRKRGFVVARAWWRLPAAMRQLASHIAAQETALGTRMALNVTVDACSRVPAVGPLLSLPQYNPAW